MLKSYLFRHKLKTQMVISVQLVGTSKTNARAHVMYIRTFVEQKFLINRL